MCGVVRSRVLVAILCPGGHSIDTKAQEPSKLKFIFVLIVAKTQKKERKQITEDERTKERSEKRRAIGDDEAKETTMTMTNSSYRRSKGLEKKQKHTLKKRRTRNSMRHG